MDRWIEVGDRVLVRRHDELDLSAGIVVGDEQVLVIDTGGDEQQGRELLRAVREVTNLPVQVAITHAHFDHCFGTRAFTPALVWAHEGCPAHLERTAESQRARWGAHYRAEGRGTVADSLASTEPVVPDRLVRNRATIDLGGRSVLMHALGPGHTDHDLVVEVAGQSVVFAGDLVENGAPPDFEDAVPAQWPFTLASLLQLEPRVVVPGHGDPVDAAFVDGQRRDIARLADLCASTATGSVSEADLIEHSPYPPETTHAALRRTPS